MLGVVVFQILFSFPKMIREDVTLGQGDVGSPILRITESESLGAIFLQQIIDLFMYAL